MGYSVISRRKRGKGCSGGCPNPALIIIKPFLLGLVAALIVSLLFVTAFALVFVVMKSIVTSAIIPLSLVALALGCFAGGFLCGSVSGQRGLFYGLAVGAAVFLGSWIIGIATGCNSFSLLIVLRLALLLLAGAVGGWLGAGRVQNSVRRRK